MRLYVKIRLRKIPTIVRQVLYLYFSGKNPKKHVFYNKYSEYENCLQLDAVSIFEFKSTKHLKHGFGESKTQQGNCM